MKKIFIVVLTLLTVCSVFFACSDEKNNEAVLEDGTMVMTQEELETFLEEVVPRANTIYAIFKTSGLPYDEGIEVEEDENGQGFLPVQGSSYQSIADLKYAAEAVYSQRYCQAEFYPDAFEGEMPRFKEINGVLYTDSMNKGFSYEETYNLETLEVMETEKERVTFTVESSIGTGVTYKNTFVLIYEDGWKIDSMKSEILQSSVM